MEKNRFGGDDFNEFIQELINNKNIDDTKERGIAKLVIDKGYDSLTQRQKYVFERSIEHYYQEDCSFCGLEIPWSEMSATEINGGKCGWCAQVHDK